MRTFLVTGPIDLRRTLWPLRRGTGDPTMRIGDRDAWFATRTPRGPATLHLVHDGDRLVAEAWGPGADLAIEDVPGWAGLLDDDRSFEPRDRVVRELHKRLRGVRLPRTGRPTEALIPAVLEQKVTGLEARRAFRALALATGEPAPGPAELIMPPDPALVAGMPAFRLHPMGVERRRAERLRGLCARAREIDAVASLPPAQARERLGPSRASDRGRPPRCPAWRSATPMPSRSVTITFPTWSVGRSPASREATTPACSSCSSRTPVTAVACNGCSRPRVKAPAYGPRSEVRSIGRL